MIKEFYESLNLSVALIILIFFKMILTSITFSECLAALVLLAFIQLDHIVKHKFPKQVDLLTELLLVQKNTQELTSKLEDHERDLTALKFNTNLRSK